VQVVLINCARFKYYICDRLLWSQYYKTILARILRKRIKDVIQLTLGYLYNYLYVFELDKFGMLETSKTVRITYECTKCLYVEMNFVDNMHDQI